MLYIYLHYWGDYIILIIIIYYAISAVWSCAMPRFCHMIFGFLWVSFLSLHGTACCIEAYWFSHLCAFITCRAMMPPCLRFHCLLMRMRCYFFFFFFHSLPLRRLAYASIIMAMFITPLCRRLRLRYLSLDIAAMLYFFRLLLHRAFFHCFYFSFFSLLFFFFHWLAFLAMPPYRRLPATLHNYFTFCYRHVLFQAFADEFSLLFRYAWFFYDAFFALMRLRSRFRQLLCRHWWIFRHYIFYAFTLVIWYAIIYLCHYIFFTLIFSFFWCWYFTLPYFIERLLSFLISIALYDISPLYFAADISSFIIYAMPFSLRHYMMLIYCLITLLIDYAITLLSGSFRQRCFYAAGFLFHFMIDAFFFTLHLFWGSCFVAPLTFSCFHATFYDVIDIDYHIIIILLLDILIILRLIFHAMPCHYIFSFFSLCFYADIFIFCHFHIMPFTIDALLFAILLFMPFVWDIFIWCLYWYYIASAACCCQLKSLCHMAHDRLLAALPMLLLMINIYMPFTPFAILIDILLLMPLDAILLFAAAFSADVAFSAAYADAIRYVFCCAIAEAAIFRAEAFIFRHYHYFLLFTLWYIWYYLRRSIDITLIAIGWFSLIDSHDGHAADEAALLPLALRFSAPLILLSKRHAIFLRTARHFAAISSLSLMMLRYFRQLYTLLLYDISFSFIFCFWSCWYFRRYFAALIFHLIISLFDFHLLPLLID